MDAQLHSGIVRRIPVIAVGGILALFGALLPRSAAAQDAKALAEVGEWAARLLDARNALSLDEGHTLQQKLQEWDLPPAKLSKEQLADLTRVHLLAALAVGDAGQAAAQYRNLANFPDDRANLRAAWLVAGATGDAELAKQMLVKLKQQGEIEAAAVDARLKQIEPVGRRSPHLGLSVSARPPHLRNHDGVVVVLTFVRLGDLKNEKHTAPLRALFEVVGKDEKIRFVGASVESEADLETVRKLASGAGWSEDFAQPIQPLLHKQFGIETTPVSVLIDQHGNVRWVASAGNPVFVYAVRAALAEAHGEYPAVLPKTVDGTAAPAPEAAAAKPAVGKARPPAEPAAEPKEEPQAKPQKDLPHDPEAARLLDQARLYQKTGRRTDAKKLLQEIIEKYPDTVEAAEAKWRLEALGG
ncbi:MAG: hypothetical protein AB1716_17245 [Planctomycetota bacterium]